MTHSVVALFLKPGPGQPMLRVSELRGVSRRGLMGDANAHPCSPRHVLLTALEDVRALHLRYDALRANILIEGPLSTFSSGDVLTLGSLRLRTTIPCDVCTRLNESRPALSKEIGARRGVLARVLNDGQVRDGSRIQRAVDCLPPMSANWHERIATVVRAVPCGQVISFAALALAAGVQSAYCRAIPAVLRKAAALGAPVHRVVPGDVSRIPETVLTRLISEGVRFSGQGLPHWDASSLYATDERPFERAQPRSEATGSARW